MTACCACDGPVHVCMPDIAAGLSALPRQIAGFPEYRLAMLRDIPLYSALSGWRAREGNDPGIMLVEMWAYVLDVLGFYDERIANESYLRTAVLPPSLRKIVELISYQPRPALASSVVLAAIADGHKTVTLPPRTGFRSDAFNGEPPQIFETENEFVIHPLKNQWTIAATREKTVGSNLLLEPETAAIRLDRIVVLRTGTTLQAGRVSSIQTITGRDGASYRKILLDPAPVLDASLSLADVEAFSPAKTAPVKSIAAIFSSGVARRSSAPAGVILDALYPELSESDVVVIQRGTLLHAATVTSASTVDVVINPGSGSIPGTTLPATRLGLDPPVPSAWIADPRRLTLQFSMTNAGKLTRVAKTDLNVSDLVLPGLLLDGVVEPIPNDVAKPGELLLLDARDEGALANGSVTIDDSGQGSVFLSAGTAPFATPLRTPVTVFGNLIPATRGESVLSETLGSGDASQAFQSFTLGKHPLTYINDSSAPNGRRSTLQVRVNGILWKEASSFFGAATDDEIYIVRQNDNGESIVSFGDGITGSRVPTGVENVAASYRFGAGAPTPPAGAIGQIAKPVEGLRRVLNPVAAGGGSDADQPKDIRRNAPASALLLGRAVSVPDFEALANEFGGVLNAHAEWAWDETRQSALVQVSFISSGGDISGKLRAFLIGFADPNTPLIAIEATPRPSQLIIDFECDPRYDATTVADQIRQTLTNADTGLLSLQHIPIGQPLFRSRIFDVVLSVEGTRSVRRMTVDGSPSPAAILVAQNSYRDFLGTLIVGGSA